MLNVAVGVVLDCKGREIALETRGLLKARCCGEFACEGGRGDMERRNLSQPPADNATFAKFQRKGICPLFVVHLEVDPKQ